MNTVRLSESYEVAIPAELRASMNLKPGQQFAVISKGRSITLVPVPELEDLIGVAAGADTSDLRDRHDRRWCVRTGLSRG